MCPVRTVTYVSGRLLSPLQQLTQLSFDTLSRNCKPEHLGIASTPKPGAAIHVTTFVIIRPLLRHGAGSIKQDWERLFLRPKRNVH